VRPPRPSIGPPGSSSGGFLHAPPPCPVSRRVRRCRAVAHPAVHHATQPAGSDHGPAPSPRVPVRSLRRAPCPSSRPRVMMRAVHPRRRRSTTSFLLPPGWPRAGACSCSEVAGPPRAPSPLPLGPPARDDAGGPLPPRRVAADPSRPPSPAGSGHGPAPIRHPGERRGSRTRDRPRPSPALLKRPRPGHPAGSLAVLIAVLRLPLTD
jgi:hypothetical protein